MRSERRDSLHTAGLQNLNDLIRPNGEGLSIRACEPDQSAKFWLKHEQSATSISSGSHGGGGVGGAVWYRKVRFPNNHKGCCQLRKHIAQKPIFILFQKMVFQWDKIMLISIFYCNIGFTAVLNTSQHITSFRCEHCTLMTFSYHSACITCFITLIGCRFIQLQIYFGTAFGNQLWSDRNRIYAHLRVSALR